MTHRVALSKYLTNQFNFSKENISIFFEKKLNKSNNHSQVFETFQKLNHEQKLELLKIVQEWAILQLNQIQE